MPSFDYEAEMSRPAQLATAAVALLMGVPTLAFGLLFLAAAVDDTEQSLIGWAVAFGALLLGSTLTTSSWRLLRGVRRGGGLFSPAALRLAAIFSVTAGVGMILTGGWHALQAIEATAFAGACWLVARNRERRVAASSSPARPLG